MSEIRAFPKSGANILSGLAQGAQIAGGIQNIQASRANVQLQQQAAQRQADQQQFAQEQQQRQEEQRNLDLQLDRTDKIIGSLVDSGILETNPDAIRPYIDSSNKLSTQRYGEGTPDFDADLIIQNANEYKKIYKTAQAMEKAGDAEGAHNYYAENAHMFIQRSKAERDLVAGEQERLGTEIAQKERSANIAEATKGLDPQVQSVIGLAAEGSITPSVAALLLKGSGVNVKSGIADAQGNPMTIVFDDAGKQIASFPEVPKAGGAGRDAQAQILREPLFNEYGEKVGEKQYAIYKNAQGDFVKKPIEEEGQMQEGLAPQTDYTGLPPNAQPAMMATPEQTKSAIAEAKRAVGPPLSPAAKKKRDVKFSTILSRMSKIAPVEGVPKPEEYLKDVFFRNADVRGNLSVSDKSILDDYKKIVEFYRKKSGITEQPKLIGEKIKGLAPESKPKGEAFSTLK